jgi:hypothetical protein
MVLFYSEIVLRVVRKRGPPGFQKQKHAKNGVLSF